MCPVSRGWQNSMHVHTCITHILRKRTYTNIFALSLSLTHIHIHTNTHSLCLSLPLSLSLTHTREREGGRERERERARLTHKWLWKGRGWFRQAEVVMRPEVRFGWSGSWSTPPRHPIPPPRLFVLCPYWPHSRSEHVTTKPLMRLLTEIMGIRDSISLTLYNHIYRYDVNMLKKL